MIPATSSNSDLGQGTKNPIVHLFPHSTFVLSFIENNNKYFNKDDHCYIVYGKAFASIKEMSDEDNIVRIKEFADLDASTMQKIKDSKKIIVHSFFSNDLMLFLLFHRLYKKSYILLWGAEFYTLRSSLTGFMGIYSRFRKWCMRKAKVFITLIPEDYEYVEKYICSKKNLVASYYGEDVAYKPKKKKHEGLRVLVGNSATSTNRHHEALSWLQHFTSNDIQVFAPLSYGDKGYGEEVAEYGKLLFGEKFFPLLDYMEANEYHHLLSTIDVAIFNNDRQQAMGNINYLLQIGTKVFLRTDTSMWNHFSLSCKCQVFDVEGIQNQTFQDFGSYQEAARKQNNEAINARFQALPQRWQNVYDD